MELIYLWVDQYKNFKDTGIILNPAYEENFNKQEIKDSKFISLKEKQDYINIFGKNLNIITIVGRNGSGKSNIISLLSYIIRSISSCHHTTFRDENNYDNCDIPKNCKFCLITKSNQEYVAYCSDNCINDINIEIINKEEKSFNAKYLDLPDANLPFAKRRLEQSKNKKFNVAKFQPFYRKEDTDSAVFTLWNGIDDISKIKLNNYFYYDRFRLYDAVRNLIELYEFNKDNELNIFKDKNKKLYFDKYSPYLDIHEALEWAYTRLKKKSSEKLYPTISTLRRAINHCGNKIKNKRYKNIDHLCRAREEVLPNLFFTFALGEIFNLIEDYEIDENLVNIIKLRMDLNQNANINTRELDQHTRRYIYRRLYDALFGPRPVKEGLFLETDAELPNNDDTQRLKKLLLVYIHYERSQYKQDILKKYYTLIDGRIIRLKEPVEYNKRNEPYITKIEDLKGISKNLYNNNKYDFYDFMSLSTGEQRLMKFFADVYYCAAKLTEENETNIFIFDEMDLSWHPEWQRKMVYYIKNLFDKISGLKGNENRIFNLIFTTHSPFILSDMPKDNVIFLQDGENVTQKVNLKTFGANIHDLFNCGLFFDCDECSTIGEFAKTVIQQDILDGIENLSQDNQAEIEYKINLIDEPLLKKALLEKLYLNKKYKPKEESIEHLRAQNKLLLQQIKEMKKSQKDEKNQC